MTRGHETKRKSDRNAIGKRSQKRSKIYARTIKKNFEISSQKPSKIALRASWVALAKTNGLQVRLGSSPGAFLNIFGAPGSVSQALLAGPGRPKSALGAPWARFWRPKHRTKSRPRVIVAALIVRERFGDDFRTIFDDVRSIFGRFWGPSMVWFVMLLSGLCRWVVVCQSQPQSTLTHADTSLF